LCGGYFVSLAFELSLAMTGYPGIFRTASSVASGFSVSRSTTPPFGDRGVGVGVGVGVGTAASSRVVLAVGVAWVRHEHYYKN